MKIAFLSALLLSGITASAQMPMMSDINPTASSNPTWLTDGGNKVLFFADNGANGNELYAYDTAPRIIYDVNPGSAPGAASSNNKKMARIGNDVYFPGDDGNTGIELYKWSGDSTSPMMVAEMRTGAAGSSINEMLVMGGKIYFNATNGINGNELWCYDPATMLAQRLTDLVAGGGNSDPRNLTEYKGKLYFTAIGTGFGTELFVYDPVNNTTVNALDIAAGISSSDPQSLTVINDKLYFSASTGSYGRELYAYDGKNMQRLTDVDNAPSDGVAAVSQGQCGIFGYKNMIIFGGNAGISNVQLFQYNPVNGVTSMVFMIYPNGPAMPSNFTAYAGKVFFSADNGTQGNELWMYDGINAPTLVADIEPGINGSNPMNMLRFGTNLFFSANTSNNGRELYMLMDSAALGVKNVKFNAEVKVYPNPATDNASMEMNLHSAETISVAVTDITGRIAYSTEAKPYDAGTNRITLPMNNMLPGMYIYTLRSNDGSLLYSGRIEKQ